MDHNNARHAMQNENVSGVQNRCEGRVLIVDTDKELVLACKDMLESCGYQVEAAYTAPSALEKIASFDAEVAVIGICPKAEGEVDFLTTFKKVRPTMLCVMMVVCADQKDAISVLEQGAYDYVPKPIDKRYLLAVLARCFEKLHLEQQKAEMEDALQARNRELQEVNDRLKTIAESTRSLAGCSDIEEINRRLLEEFARNMAAGGGSLYLVKEDALILEHTLDPGHALSRIPFPLREGSVFEKVLKRKQPILVKDIEQESGFLKSGWTGYQNGSLLVFPLLGATRDLQGLITLHNRMYPPFTKQDREIGTILASYSYEILRATYALEELRVSEARYRRIFENIQDVYYETLVDGTIVEMNPSIESVLRYRREELLNTSVERLYADLRDRAALLKQLSRQGHVTDYEVRLKDKDGSVVFCSITARLQYDAHGTPWKLYGSLRDITERKRAETKLKEQKILLDEIFNGVQEGIGIVDEHEIILFCNPAYAAIFEQKREQLIGTSLLSLFDAEASAIILQQTRERQAGKITTYELPLLTQKGNQKYIRVTVSPHFTANGAYSGAFGAILDITDRKRSEEKVHQLNKELEQRVQQRTADLERMNLELRHLVYAASHDLKTPLRGISYLAHCLVEDYAEAFNDEGKRIAKLLMNRVIRMDVLIDGIREYAGVERRKDREVAINLNTLLRNIVTGIAPPSHIQVTIEGEFPVITGDKKHILQVFQHLIKNAVSFMDKPEGHIQIGWQDGGEDWIFRVTDNGSGIDAKYYDRIFQIFQVLVPGEGHKNIGIGLALVKKIVQLHGGTVWVESEVGKGSTFYFTLPKNRGTQ